jgi:hypothetical protein
MQKHVTPEPKLDLPFDKADSRSPRTGKVIQKYRSPLQRGHAKKPLAGRLASLYLAIESQYSGA